MSNFMSVNSNIFTLLENHPQNKIIIEPEQELIMSEIITELKSLTQLQENSQQQDMLNFINSSITLLNKKLVEKIKKSTNEFIEKNRDIYNSDLIKNEIDDCTKQLFNAIIIIIQKSILQIVDMIPVIIKTKYAVNLNNLTIDIIEKLMNNFVSNSENIEQDIIIKLNNLLSEKLKSLKIIQDDNNDISKINSEQLAKELLKKNISVLGKQFTNDEKEMILRIIINSIQTTILQLNKLPNMNESIINLINVLKLFITDENKTLKLFEKVSNNKKFNEILTIEGFNNNQYNDVMDVVNKSIIESFEEQSNFSYTTILVVCIIIILIITIGVFIYSKLY